MRVLSIALCLAFAQSAHAYDLTKPEELLEAYVKTVGDLSGKDVIGYGKVTIFAKRPGEKGVPLFNFEVVGVKRYEKIEGGYRRIQREIGFYTDLETGEILETWDNPFNGRNVSVVPVLNDPVNRDHVIDEQGTGWSVKYEEYGDDIIFHREIMLRYPSALPRSEYPLYSQDDWYEAAELFNNYVSRADLENAETTSAPATGSWTRFGPWLPWMEMADASGMLIYHGHSLKLSSKDAVPAHLREAIEAKYPQYMSAPDSYYGPDQTSWTVFKALIDAQRAEQEAE